MQETRVHFLGQEIPWRKNWQPTLVFLPGEFHGQKSLVGPQGPKELDTTEHLSTHLCGSPILSPMVSVRSEILNTGERRYEYMMKAI